MAKRRTKKDKKNAKHNFLVSWEPDTEDPKLEKEKSKTKKSKKKDTSSSIKNTKFVSIKKDILKSISLAGIILGLELVIYLVLWKNSCPLKEGG